MADCTHAFCLPHGRGCMFDSAAHTDAHGNLVDTCGYCQFLPTTGEPVRAVQVGCPVHSEHPDARRVRTQAERDADGTELPPVSYADQLIARHGQPMQDAIDRARVRYEAAKADARQPRRRWWHRLTRRAL